MPINCWSSFVVGLTTGRTAGYIGAGCGIRSWGGVTTGCKGIGLGVVGLGMGLGGMIRNAEWFVLQRRTGGLMVMSERSSSVRTPHAS